MLGLTSDIFLKKSTVRFLQWSSSGIVFLVLHSQMYFKKDLAINVFVIELLVMFSFSI